jgi:hypothetical protein
LIDDAEFDAFLAENEPEIPDPPPSPTFESFDELFMFLQDFYGRNGGALVKHRCGPKRKINGAMIYTHRTLVCDRFGMRPSESARMRRTATQKTNCQFKITAKTSQKKSGL